jgi:hypothetical protein
VEWYVVTWEEKTVSSAGWPQDKYMWMQKVFLVKKKKKKKRKALCEKLSVRPEMIADGRIAFRMFINDLAYPPPLSPRKS